MCESCEELKRVLADLSASEQRLLDGREDLTRELAVVLARERRLKQELAQVMEDDPNADTITSILKHWRTATNHPKAKIPLSGARAKIVKARLKHFNSEDLRAAIDGAAKLPYVTAQGRSATGKPHQRHDDLTLIFRDETTVERFIGYVRQDIPAVDPGRTVPRRERPVPTEPAVDRLLARLEGVREERAGQWVARCPAHEDRHASLSVAQGAKGAVVHCHAGCDPVAIAAASGMDIGELFDAEHEPATSTSSPPDPLPSETTIREWEQRLIDHPALLERLRVVRGWELPALSRLGVGWDGQRLTLPIRDADGTLVSLVRYLPGGKPKSLGAKGHRRDLFPAVETLDPDAQVWIVEGEPDAITATQLGLAATAVPGVNGWRKPWADRFAGRRVVICMDCDEHGRTAAAKIAAGLTGYATEVRIVDLDEQAADGMDISDAVREGASLQIIEALAQAAPVIHSLDERRAA